MEKEYLEQLKKKINDMSPEEKKTRDSYLKELSKGNIQGPPVGYVSIDKPQLKEYRDNPIVDINPNQTIYQLIFDDKNMDKIVLSFLGIEWTKRKLKMETDKLANQLFLDGIKKGDKVLVGLSNSLDTVVTFLALNKIGACSKWFDIRAGSDEIVEYSNSSNCKCMIAFDMLVDKIKKGIDKTKLKKVILMNPVQRLSTAKKNFLKITKATLFYNIPNDERFVDYMSYIDKPNCKINIECAKFDKNRPSIMLQSSGTTGKPKTIVHSDYSATQCIREIAYSDLPLGSNKEILVALPPWIAYGIGNATILPLAMGTKVELCPNFDQDIVYKNIGKFTIAFAAPFHYRFLKDHFSKLSRKQKKLFSKVECLVSGGDKISEEENKSFEEVFGVPLVNGYGNNEGWGALTVNPMLHNKYGTVGIPKYDETIYAYDSENNVELPTGVTGELYAKINTSFLGYENNKNQTDDVIKDSNDGITMKTGDIGHIDSDGFVHLSGRLRRVIVRLGFKISAYTIEDNITENNFVKECVAVAVKDDIDEHVPMVYIVLKDSINVNDEILKEIIIEKCRKELKEYELPKYIRFVDTLPYTQNNKYDFMKLEEDGNAFVDNLNNKQISGRTK